MRFWRIFLLAVFLLSFCCHTLWASPEKKNCLVQGTVINAQTKKPIVDAIVLLSNGTRTYLAKSNSTGAFKISVPEGVYTLEVKADGYETKHFANLVLLPPKKLSLSIALNVKLYTVKGISVVEKELPPQTPYDRSKTFFTTRIAQGNTWQGILATVPGVQLNAFGQIHTRGEHQLVSFTMDGIQLPVLPESEIGFLVYPGFLSRLDIQTGSFDPSLAGQTGVVAQLFPIEAKQTSEGELKAYGGDHGQYGFDGYWAGRSLDAIWNYFVGLQGDHTDLRLEPPNPVQQTLNNVGTEESAFFHASQKDSNSSMSLAYGREISSFGIPDTPSAFKADVVQKEQDANTFALFSWSHFLSERWKLNLGAAWLSTVQSVVNNGIFTPFVVANPITMPNAFANGLPANPEDLGSPYLPTINRMNSQILLNISSSFAISKENLLQVGLASDFIQTSNFYDILDAGGAGTLPTPHVKISGNYSAFNGTLFAEAHLHLSTQWHLDIGANLDRFDNGQGLVDEQLNPFLNVAYALSTHEIFHFSFNHEFNIPPIVPDLTGTLSAFPENVNNYELNYKYQNPHWSFRIGPYLKNFSNQLDGSLLLPFSNLPIFYPVNFTTSRDLGLELFEATNKHLGWNEFFSYSLSFAQSTSPGASPTSLANPLYLDHDQRHTLDVGFSYNFPAGVYASMDAEYGSGFPQDAAAIYNLDGVYPFGIHASKRVPSFVANLNVGWRNKKEPVQIWLEVFNLFDNTPDITFLSDFTGTRFVKERSIVFHVSGQF
jgi:hypothetical protein